METPRYTVDEVVESFVGLAALRRNLRALADALDEEREGRGGHPTR